MEFHSNLELRKKMSFMLMIQSEKNSIAFTKCQNTIPLVRVNESRDTDFCLHTIERTFLRT
jgi:hypothetical protein